VSWWLQSSGDSGANVKRLEEETAAKIEQLTQQAASISPDVIQMLLRHVTTVKNWGMLFPNYARRLVPSIYLFLWEWEWWGIICPLVSIIPVLNYGISRRSFSGKRD
jgi:hypothetical protein